MGETQLQWRKELQEGVAEELYRMIQWKVDEEEGRQMEGDQQADEVDPKWVELPLVGGEVEHPSVAEVEEHPLADEEQEHPLAGEEEEEHPSADEEGEHPSTDAGEEHLLADEEE